MDEQELIQLYRESKETYRNIALQIEQHFVPMAAKLIDEDKRDQVRGLISRCPDELTRSLMQDMLRYPPKEKFKGEPKW
jgi:hypothetical protein